MTHESYRVNHPSRRQAWGNPSPRGHSPFSPRAQYATEQFERAYRPAPQRPAPQRPTPQQPETPNAAFKTEVQAAQKVLVQKLLSMHSSLPEAFRAMDADGSGRVSKREFTTILKTLSLNGIRPPVIRGLFELIDSDSSGDVDYKEFLQALNAKDSSRVVFKEPLRPSSPSASTASRSSRASRASSQRKIVELEQQLAAERQARRKSEQALGIANLQRQLNEEREARRKSEQALVRLMPSGPTWKGRPPPPPAPAPPPDPRMQKRDAQIKKCAAVGMTPDEFCEYYQVDEVPVYAYEIDGWRSHS